MRTLFETVHLIEGIEVTPHAPEEQESTTEAQETGYELNDEDWSSLLAIKDGRSETVDPAVVAFLESAGLIEPGLDKKPTQFALDWIGQVGIENGDSA